MYRIPCRPGPASRRSHPAYTSGARIPTARQDIRIGEFPIVTRVHALFDCKHETDVDVSIDPDVRIPNAVRGLGQCPDCMGEQHLIAVSGVAPQAGGRELVLDSILMMPIEG